MLFAKGASESMRQQAVKKFERLSSDGFRVLAVAVKQGEGLALLISEAQLTMAVFVAFLDLAKKGSNKRWIY